MADITTDQNFPNCVLAIKNSRGGPAKVDGTPVWASSDETVLVVTASSDGMSAADADLGEGVEPLTGVTIELSLGAPADKP